MKRKPMHKCRYDADGMEAGGVMSVQEIGGKGKGNIPEYPGKRAQGHSEGFQESLMQNLKYQGQTRDGTEKTEPVPCRNEEKAGVGMLGSMAGIRVSAVTRREAVQAAEVRHMSYEESDHIEIAVTEGYTLKGKLEGSHVYVEAKYDDGRLEAYRVDTGKVQEQTQHRIEQFAVETAERYS